MSADRTLRTTLPNLYRNQSSHAMKSIKTTRDKHLKQNRSKPFLLQCLWKCIYYEEWLNFLRDGCDDQSNKLKSWNVEAQYSIVTNWKIRSLLAQQCWTLKTMWWRRWSSINLRMQCAYFATHNDKTSGTVAKYIILSKVYHHKAKALGGHCNVLWHCNRRIFPNALCTLLIASKSKSHYEQGHWKSERAGGALKMLWAMGTYQKQKSLPIVLVSVQQQCWPQK